MKIHMEKFLIIIKRNVPGSSLNVGVKETFGCTKLMSEMCSEEN